MGSWDVYLFTMRRSRPGNLDDVVDDQLNVSQEGSSQVQ